MTSRFPQLSTNLIDGFRVPILNTTLLLTSRFYATFALHSLSIFCFLGFFFGMFFSIALRVFFTFFQRLEYLECSFSIMSGTFGSIFFLATGFHGAHVFIGTSFLIASFLRRVNREFVRGRTIGFLACIWY